MILTWLSASMNARMETPLFKRKKYRSREPSIGPNAVKRSSYTWSIQSIYQRDSAPYYSPSSRAVAHLNCASAVPMNCWRLVSTALVTADGLSTGEVDYSPLLLLIRGRLFHPSYPCPH